MSITIRGENINVVRPERIHKPQLPKTVWKRERIKRPRLIKRTLLELQRIAADLGYEFNAGGGCYD